MTRKHTKKEIFSRQHLESSKKTAWTNFLVDRAMCSEIEDLEDALLFSISWRRIYNVKPQLMQAP